MDIAGWFPDANRKVLKDLMVRFNIRDVIEVGSFVGKSTALFALYADMVYAVDPFVMWEEGRKEAATAVQYGDDFYEQFLLNMKEAGVLEKIMPIRMTGKEAIEKVFNTPVDLVYIDAAHDYESVLEDLKMYGPLAKKFICGDDYDVHWPGVMQAVDEIYPQRQVYGNLWIAPILAI